VIDFLFLLALIMLVQANGRIARFKGLSSLRWVVYSILSCMICGTIGSMIVLSFFYRHTFSDPELLRQASSKFSDVQNLFILFSSLGGALLMRRRLETIRPASVGPDTEDEEE
jgi:lysylphosphatidylglycerol synthetase-like protein (DUF2156 family)